jgi:hypothetical protein
MIELSIIRDLVAIAGVFIALSYYIMNLRNLRQTRQAQIYLNIMETFRSTEFLRQWHITETARWKDFDDYKEKYSPENNPEVLTASTTVFLFFESVGTLVRKKLIDFDLVDGQLAIAIVAHWRRWESIILGDRGYFQSPGFWSDFEYIYKELDKTGQYASIRSPHEIETIDESSTT